jgi:hypothetical protein
MYPPNYGMWPPPPWSPQPSVNIDDTLRALHKMRRQEKKRQKEEEEEKKRSELGKRKPRTYSLLDVFLILFSCSWFVGPLTAMAMIKVTQNFLLTIQPIVK